MEIIFYYLSRIPDVVWSGIVASIITLSGVMLSNGSNTKRLRQQLEHDASEKSKDRQAILRREVYLRAAEEMAKLASFMGSIPQLDSSKVNISDGMQGFFQTSAKLQLVAGLETAGLVGDLTTKYGELLLKLVIEVEPIHDINSDIRICTNHYEKYQAEINRVLAQLTYFNESHHTDEKRFTALQNSLNFFMGEADRYSEDRQKNWEVHSRLHKQFVNFLWREMKDIGKLQMYVTSAMRRELEVDAHPNNFQQKMEEDWQRMDKALSDFLSKSESEQIN